MMSQFYSHRVLLLITPLLLISKNSLSKQGGDIVEPENGTGRCTEENEGEGKSSHPLGCEQQLVDEKKGCFVFKCDPYKGWKGSLIPTVGVMPYRYDDVLMGKVTGEPLTLGLKGHLLFPEHHWSFNAHVLTSSTLMTNNSKTVSLSEQDGSTSLFARAQDQESERYDYSASFNLHSSDDRVRILLGYRWTDTTIKGRALTFPGTIVPTNPVAVMTVPLQTQVHLKTHGPFIGLRVVPWRETWGAVGFNVTWLPLTNGEYNYTDTYLTSVFKVPDLSTDAQSHRVYQVGADLEMPLPITPLGYPLNFSASANYYHYKMNTLKTFFPDGRSFGGFPIREDMWTVNLGLVIKFGVF